MYRKASILLNLCAINKCTKPLHRHITIKCVFVHMWYVNVLYIACTPVV